MQRDRGCGAGGAARRRRMRIRAPRGHLLTVPLVLSLSATAAAQEQPKLLGDRPNPPIRLARGKALTTESLCLLFDSAASANGLPLDFFVRLIWQESRFKPNAIGPVTRSGARARGIAQFMPRTAAERGLRDPRDPIAALPKSAEFLRELRAEFGNLGLAAAAYDAGARRVHDWLDGVGSMPAETRAYVTTITGRSVEEWKGVNDTGVTLPPPKACTQIVADLRNPPAPLPAPTTLVARNAPSRDDPTMSTAPVARNAPKLHGPTVAGTLGVPGTFMVALEEHVSAGVARPWGAELAAGFSRAQVLKTYATLEAQHGAALAGADAMIIHGQFRNRGTGDFYQVRVGADTRAGAEEVCQRLARDGIACLVLRNSPTTMVEAIQAAD
jgi:hypothetical protein